MPELQRVLAALVFGSSTKVAPYKALFAEGRWALLLELFLRELFKLHALLPESALTVHLQVRWAPWGGGFHVRRRGLHVRIRADVVWGLRQAADTAA
jgi:hypothetical protein